MIHNLFSVPVWKSKPTIPAGVAADLLSSIRTNYESHRDYLDPAWNCVVFSTYRSLNNVDYSSVLPHYRQTYDAFVARLELHAHDYEISRVWHNVYRRHSSQELHDHIGDDVIFSGVHFLKLASDQPKLTFYNPSAVYAANPVYIRPTQPLFVERRESHSLYFPHLVFDVEQGDVVIFPASLQHAVFQQTVDTERITVSFNIKLST